MSKFEPRIARRDGSEGTEGPIEIWDVNTGEQLAVLAWRVDVRFSGNGKTLASGDTGGKIHLRELLTQHHLTIFDGDKNDIRTLAFAPDGQTLASISRSDGIILFWKVPTK